MADRVGQNTIEMNPGDSLGQGRRAFTSGQWDRQVARAEAAFRAGDVKQAIEIYEQGIGGGVDSVSAFQTLGELRLFVRDYQEALRWLERAWSLDTTALILDRIVLALAGLGCLEQAYECVSQALNNQTVSDIRDTQLAEALYLTWPYWHQAQRGPLQEPERLVQALRVLADWLFEANQTELARQAYEKMLEHSDNAFAHARLGHLQRFGGSFSQALSHLQAAVDLEPGNASYQGMLGNLLLMTGEIERGLAQLREAVCQNPHNAELHSSYLLSSHYAPDQDRQALFDEHRRWGRLHAPQSLMFKRVQRDLDPQRRLRIGYLGADFRQHSVGYTFAGVLTGRNKAEVTVYGYGSVSQADAVTERFRQLFDVYHDVYPLDDAALARLIEADQIDILVAVAGHSFGHRLKVLAYKPVPIQVDYGGINTLGLEQVDYRISDRQLDPPASQAFFLEKLIYLPTGSTCYCPAPEGPVLGALPAAQRGFVTFSCFNGAQKVNRLVLSLWAQILRAVPNARLLIKCPGGDEAVVRHHLTDKLAQMGIKSSRVTVCGLLARDKHLERYNQVDIALDTYPFTGGVTSLEGLWMGVPLITLAGDMTVSRIGSSILAQLGLEAFTAYTPEQYVKKAAALAANPEALARIRASMRQRMLASALCDPARHAQALEAAYRRMWQDYCRSQAGSERASKTEVRA